MDNIIGKRGAGKGYSVKSEAIKHGSITRFDPPLPFGYDLGAFPVNYINPAVALSVEEIESQSPGAGYPISGDNIARVRAGVR